MRSLFQFKHIELDENRSYKYRLYKRDQRISFTDFLKFLRKQKSFRSFFINLLKQIPFQAYHWETPPVSLASKGQGFEFVVTDSPGIDLPPDPGPFQKYFTEDAVAVFRNLGGDAKLIAPRPHPQDYNYSHIGSFSRQAPLEQQHALWKKVGEVTETYLSDRPLWLNTAGGGVAWLHIRLDSRPKYYRYQPYCEASG